MLENIRRIGIFMIAAQTVIHFAAGRQYEKYLKIIAGVIILLQFMAPFAAASGDLVAKWQEEMKRTGEQIENKMQQAGHGLFQDNAYPMSVVEETALRGVEEELRNHLSDVIAERGYIVSRLTIRLKEADKKVRYSEETGNDVWELQCVSVTVRADAEKTAASEETREKCVEEISIEEIVVGEAGQNDEGSEGMQETDQDLQECRMLIAQTLGIAVDKVEVTYDGEW